MTHTTAPAAQTTGTDRPAGSGAARQSFLLLRTAFTVAPIAFGLDKFFR